MLRTLTDEERNARAHALADSRLREAEERKIAEEEARRRQSREVVDKTEREAADARKREEEDRRKHDEEAKRKADDLAKKRFGEEEAKRAGPGARLALEADEEEAPRAAPRRCRPSGGCSARGAPRRRRKAARPPHAGHRAARRRSARALGRLVPPPHASGSRVRPRNEPKEKLVREVTIPEAITIQELANRMTERAVDVIQLLMKQGQMATINDMIDADTAQLIAEEMGHTVRRVAEADVEEGLFDTADDPEAARSRARRWSPSWATSTTARPRCSTPSARPTWRAAKPAASPSTSAPIR